MKKYIILAALIAFNTALTACNTMEGMGQDIQKGGENLENSADKHKQFSASRNNIIWQGYKSPCFLLTEYFKSHALPG